MKKLILLTTLYCLLYNHANAQNCQGNACSAISFISQPNGKQSIRNSSNKTVSVGVKWYFSQCQNLAYWTIAGGQTLDFPYNSHCLPYTANFQGPPPGHQPGSVVFKNNTGSPIFLFYTITDNNSVTNFCSVSTNYRKQIDYGDLTSAINIAAGKILTYYFYTVPSCDDNANVKFHGAIFSDNAKGNTIVVN